MIASILFDILGIFNLAERRYGWKRLAEGDFCYLQCGSQVVLSTCWEDSGSQWISFHTVKGNLTAFLTDENSLLCFVSSE